MANATELRSSRLPQGEPGQWDQSAALREAARIYLPQQVVDVVRSWVEGGFYEWLERWAGPTIGRSYLELSLEAARADLRYSARFLAQVARETLVECESPEVEEELAWFADGLALRVEELADLIEEQLGPVRRAVPATEETVRV